MANKLTENTLIPISLLAILIPAIIWLADVAAKASETRTRVEQIEEREDVLMDIQLRLARIEERLNVIYRQRSTRP